MIGGTAMLASMASAQVAHRADPHGLASPVAQVRVFGAEGRMARRSFDLVNGTATHLCLASSTGRFRLRVTSGSGGMLRGLQDGATIAYRVRFRDATGTEQIKQMRGAEVFFEGRSPGQVDCTGGANAFLLVDSPEQDLLTPPAGTYIDRLSLSVEPL